jgi:hypothetical protein
MSGFTADDSHEHDDICDNVFDAIDYVFSKTGATTGVDMMMNLMKKR